MKYLILLIGFFSVQTFADLKIRIYSPQNEERPIKEATLNAIDSFGRSQDHEPSLFIGSLGHSDSYCLIGESVAKANGFTLGELYIAITLAKDSVTSNSELNCWVKNLPGRGQRPEATLFSLGSKPASVK